jgi:pimeloyl-ACP methyl ester carboxylesterase
LPDIQTAQLHIDGIEIHIDGDGPEVLLMIHGWPDTWRLWDAQVAYFKPHYRCVRFTLPGFDVQGPRRAHSLDDLIGFFQRVADAVSPDAPVTLMLHDWGCIFGYQFALRHPARVRRIVGVDVGDGMSAEFIASCSAKAKAGIFAYQAWLAIAWLVGGHLSQRLGDTMTRWMARQLGCRSEPTLMGACMNYPYFITWFPWSARHGSYRRMLAVAPECPMFFAWAERKPFMLHSPVWLARIAARPGNQVQSFATGHWVMTRAAVAFNQAVGEWLRDEPEPPSTMAAR